MKRLLVGIAVIVLAFGVVGCSAISDKIGEEVGEEIVGGALGGDVEVDGDSVTIETEDGATTVTGDTGEIPDGFPDDFPLPDNYKIDATSSIEGSNEVQYYINLVSEDSVSDIYDWYKGEFTGGGWSLTTDVHMASGGDDTAMLVGEKGDMVGTVTLASSADGSEIGIIVVVK